MRKRLCIVALILLALVVIQRHLLAQATASGAVGGTVTDSSQAVINGAEVIIVSAATDEKCTMTTNSTGSFRFDLLPASAYKLTIFSQGFSTIAQSIELLVGQTVTSNVMLRPGAATRTVEVAGDNPLIDTTKTSVSTESTPTEVEQPPMVGHDVANLAYLAPGVKFSDYYDPTKARYAILSVNGGGGWGELGARFMF